MNNGLNKENLLYILPPSLAKDPSIVAMAIAAAELLEARLAEIDRVRVISNIDELDEDVLDILARDFKVDWWDPEYLIDEKRRTLKSSWRVHKTLGTKAAVETAIRAIYPLSQVEEWFDYGGDPYHFRLNINITSDGGDRIRRKRVLDRLNFYKSLRSHNDGVRYFLLPEKSWATAGGLLVTNREVIHRKVPTPELIKPGARATATTGGKLVELHITERANVQTPELIKPGGRAAATAGGVLTGTRQIVTIHPAMPTPTKPQGTATAASGVGVAHSYERRRVKVRAALARPGGAARAGCGVDVAYSYQRQTVRVAI